MHRKTNTIGYARGNGRTVSKKENDEIDYTKNFFHILSLKVYGSRDAGRISFLRWIFKERVEESIVKGDGYGIL